MSSSRNYPTTFYETTCQGATQIEQPITTFAQAHRLLRLKQILAPEGPIPVSRATWYAKVKSGEFPQPIRLSARVTCYSESSILELIEKSFEGKKF